MTATTWGAATLIGGANVHALIPHGASHIEAIIAQAPNVMAMGPASTQMAIAASANTRRIARMIARSPEPP